MTAQAIVQAINESETDHIEIGALIGEQVVDTAIDGARRISQIGVGILLLAAAAGLWLATKILQASLEKAGARPRRARRRAGPLRA